MAKPEGRATNQPKVHDRMLWVNVKIGRKPLTLRVAVVGSGRLVHLPLKHWLKLELKLI